MTGVAHFGATAHPATMGCQFSFDRGHHMPFDADEWNAYNPKLVKNFCQNDGVVTLDPFVGAPILLLRTVGAKTGREWTIPVSYILHGDGFVIIASRGGSPRNPDWLHNLRTHPDVVIEVGPDTV